MSDPSLSEFLKEAILVYLITIPVILLLVYLTSRLVRDGEPEQA